MTEPIISADLVHKMQPVRLIAKLPDSTSWIALTADTSGRLILGLNAGDIQIGAVEIKDHDSELRLEVGADGEDIGSAAQVAAFKDTLGKIQRALVDGSGHLQIDVLSSDLPTGAATELTLDAVKTAAEAIDSKEGITGAVSAIDGTRAAQLRYIGERVQLLTTGSMALLYGNKTIAAAGAAEPLSADQQISSGRAVIIKALHINTGLVYVGDDSVSAINGFQLYPGEESPGLAVTNLNQIYLDVDVPSDGVTWVVER